MNGTGPQHAVVSLATPSHVGTVRVQGSVLQRKCACGGVAGPTGECGECRAKRLRRKGSGAVLKAGGYDFGGIAVGIQTKLTVGDSEDPLEREADEAASAVVAGSGLAQIADGGAISAAGRRSHEEEGTLRRKDAGNVVPTTEAPAAVHDALAENGQPLDRAAQTFMESRLGHDFSHVRVHEGSTAAASARAVNARAYTVGTDVVFATGEYAPHTQVGRRLLAHELTHVVQQDGGRGRQGSTPILQRQIQYLKQLSSTEAAEFIKTFDKTADKMEQQAAGVPGPEGDDFRAAMTRIRNMRKAGKVTFWEVFTGGKQAFASYDNKTDELRIHVNIGKSEESPVTIMHEAIHAVHADRYPKLREAYAKGLKGGVKDRQLGILLLKWKAWTEYWAYRRHIEFGNVAGRACQLDVHLSALKRDDVRISILKVREETGQDFDPSTWAPPARYETAAARAAKQTQKIKYAMTGRTGTTGARETVKVDKKTTLAEAGKTYGYDLTCLRRFNPEIDQANIAAGAEIWVVQREKIPAGIHRSLGDFSRGLGNFYLWPKVWAANPQITRPDELKSDDKIKIPKEVAVEPFATLE